MNVFLHFQQLYLQEIQVVNIRGVDAVVLQYLLVEGFVLARFHRFHYS